MKIKSKFVSDVWTVIEKLYTQFVESRLSIFKKNNQNFNISNNGHIPNENEWKLSGENTENSQGEIKMADSMIIY